ncbi:MAG: hypothetical protein ACYCZX_12410 [Rhodospirillaceae bacterium]
MLNRRHFIAGAGASLAASAAARDVPGASGLPLSAIVQMDGGTFRFDAADGEDQGDFVSPIGGFTQRCLRVTRTDCPLVVYFRPDSAGGRQEVVFELGDLWAGTPRHLGAYRVVISGAGREQAIDIPRHFWFSRWRWQSAPRPVVAAPAALIAKGLLPPYELETKGAKGLPEAPAPTEKGRAIGLGTPSRGLAAASYRPMELAGVEPHMGATGERADIGLVTEAQARYICTGASGALAALRAQAEAAGTLPWHMRDSRTGAPVDLDAHATMSWYPDRAVGKPQIEVPKSDISIDAAHQPSLAYLPYLLTGDPYHLEDLQFAANYNRGWFAPEYRLSIPQTRAFAWSLRTLAQAALVTPASTPRWLMPRGYWTRDLARTRDWFTQHYVQSGDVLRRVFRITDNPASSRDEGPTTPAGTWSAPWMDEFLAASLGWMVMMGYEDWRPAFLWKVASTLARTDGKSGWARAHATPYRIILRPAVSAPYVESWAEAYALTSRLWNWPPPTDDIVGNDLTYFIYTRGVLTIAAKLGVAGARENLAWLDGQLRARRAAIDFKWRMT